MAWVDLDLFKAYARDSTVVDDALYTIALDGAHLSVADFCQRSFDEATGTTSERVYSPLNGGCDVLRIHDCVSVTSITDNGSTITATNYQLEPFAVELTGEARPYEQVRLYNDTWTYDYGFARIAITADWGWTATPQSVVQATLIVAKDLLQQRNNNSGVAGFGDFGAVRVRENPMVGRLLQRYQREEAWGLA